MADRNVGYYFVHYTNLPTVNDGIQTDLSLGYWNGSSWSILLRSGDVSGGFADSQMDHIYPQLSPQDNPPPEGPVFRWVKPPGHDWQVARSEGNDTWEILRDTLSEDAIWRERDLEALGNLVIPPSES